MNRAGAAEPGRAGEPVWPIIIPARDEEAAIQSVLREIRSVLPSARFPLVVGVNGSRDRTAEVVRTSLVEESHAVEEERAGYGWGCLAAMRWAETRWPGLAGFAFAAADGATDPRDLLRVVGEADNGFDLVCGSRSFRPANWPVLGFGRALANLALGAWAGLAGGALFTDLGPVRALRAGAWRRIEMREMTYGWTIEMQVRAARAGLRLREISAAERPRLAGEQKVSGRGWRVSLRIAATIAAAGWRARSA